MAAFVTPDGISPFDLFDMIGQRVADQYAAAELQIIAALARVASRRGVTDATLEQRLRDVQYLRRTAQDAVRSLTAESAEHLVRVAERQGVAAAVRQMELVPRMPEGSVVTTAQADAVALTLADLGNALDQMHQRILRWDVDEYQALIAGQVPAVTLGISGTIKTQRAAVQKWLASGIPGFVDRAGRAWRPGSYAEMAVRTASRRAYVDAQVNQFADSGISLVTVIVGNAACELCAPWIDKVLSTDGITGPRQVMHATEDRLVTVEVVATLEQARREGLFHPNCRCHVAPYFPGLEIPNAADHYDPEAEAARDKQRAMERGLRDTKRTLAATLDPTEQVALRRDIRDQQKALRDHIETNGLPRKSHREQPWWSDGKTA